MKSKLRGAIRRFGARGMATCGIVCVLICSLGLVSGQQETSISGSGNRLGYPVSPGVYRTGTKISVTSDLVLIPVTVTDGSGRAVSGLEKEHFTLFENGAKQEITHFASEDVPVSIGIVFDASGSMAPRMRQARAVVNAIVANSNPDDEFLLVRFSTETRLVVPLTSRHDEIRRAVGSLDVSGGTALLDAVSLAIAELKQHARHQRKAIILVSDGEDNSSHMTVNQLKAEVREQDVLIHAIRLDDSQFNSGWPPPQRPGLALLREITSQTGGRLFTVTKVKQLPAMLRNQYMLGYSSSNSEKDGSYRKIQLKLARPKGFPKLHAVWRQGYYAPRD